MNNLSKLGMRPKGGDNFQEPATEKQIAELERYCGHSLPEDYKTILKNYNGGCPEPSSFCVIDEYTGVPLEYELGYFYMVNDKKELLRNIWWIINSYPEYFSPNMLPFADNGNQQIYYLKWVNNIPEVWYLLHVQVEEEETRKIASSFEKFIDAFMFNFDPWR